MAKNEYTINIKNTIDVTNSNNPTTVNQNIGADGLKPYVPSNQVQDGPSFAGINGRFAIINSMRALESIAGDTEIVQTLSKISKYVLQTGGIVKAISNGNYSSLIGLAITLSLEAISQAKTNAQKEASYLNSVDQERMANGIIDITNVKISSNWWSKRYEYERKK